MEQPKDAGPAFNPSLQEQELNEEEAERIRGDRIGETLYSAKFVLGTVLKLKNLDGRPLKDDEQFETDLCALWDMTIEKDVIKLLLEHSVLEIFSSCIADSDDSRLVEILIGTVANMCSVEETRDHLCSNPDITYPILLNIGCFDALTLIQLMRFIQTALVFNSGDEAAWFQHFEQVPDFVDKLSFVLSNSVNLNLLVATFEAVNSIYTTFSVLDCQSAEEGTETDTATARDFKEVFVRSTLVASLNDAFKQLLFPEPGDEEEPTEEEEDKAAAATSENEAMESTLLSKKKNRIMNLYLDVLVILSGFESVSLDAFIDCLPETLENVAWILGTFCSPLNLLPLTSNEQGLLENVNELFQALQDPFASKCFSRIVHIYSILDGDCRQKQRRGSEEESGWDEKVAEEEVDAEETCTTLLELITRITVDVEQSQLETAIKDLGPLPCQSVFDGLNRDEDTQLCADKFKLALKNLWNVERANGDVQL